jgi:hypothetical protein
MRAFGRAPHYSQNLEKLSVYNCSGSVYHLDDDSPPPIVLETLHDSLQQRGAFPRLTFLRMVGWNGDAQTKEALKKCKQAMEERGGRFFREEYGLGKKPL